MRNDANGASLGKALICVILKDKKLRFANWQTTTHPF